MVRPKQTRRTSRPEAPSRSAAGPTIDLAVTGGTRRRDDVVSRIRRLILEQELRPGDRLPGERQLAREFGVSRGLVREAIQFLATIGLLKVRHGGGSFLQVTPGDTRRLRRSWREWVSDNRGLVLETLEVRIGAEAFAAELAAQRASPEDLERMVRALHVMRAANDSGDTAALVQSDLAFHEAVLGATGNKTLREFLGALGSELIPERAAVWDLEGRIERSFAEHFAIYEAIRAGDRQGAAQAMRRHIESVRGDILSYVIGDVGLDRPQSEAGAETESEAPKLAGRPSGRRRGRGRG